VGNTPTSWVGVHDYTLQRVFGKGGCFVYCCGLGLLLLGCLKTRARPSMSTSCRSDSPSERNRNPCGQELSLQIWRAYPFFLFSWAFCQSLSRTLLDGFPRKVPGDGSISQRDSSPFKLTGTFFKIIRSIKHLRNIG